MNYFHKFKDNRQLMWLATFVCSFIIWITPEPIDCTLGTMLQAQLSKNMLPPVDNSGLIPMQSPLTFNSKLSAQPVQAIQKNNVATPLKVDRIKSIEPIQTETNIDIFKEVKGFMSRFIAPAKAYAELINRYHSWYTGYQSVRKLVNHPTLEPIEVFQLEYTRMEQKLLEQEVKKVKISTAVDHKIEENENLDFVFNIFKQIIGNLESDLELLEKNEGVVAEVNIHPEAAIENEELINETMARIKRSFMNTAKFILKEETGMFMKRAAYQGLAVYMEAKPNTGDLLDHLRPIISILACASTPLATAYLNDIKFRTYLTIVTHSLDSVKPLSEITKNLEDSVRRLRKRTQKKMDNI